MSSEVTCVTVGYLQTNCYIVKDDESGFLAVIDPGDDAEKIQTYLEMAVNCQTENKLEGRALAPTHIILTHCHFDHVGALAELRKKYPMAMVAVGSEENTDPEYIAQIAKGALGSFYVKFGLDKKIKEIGKPDILLKDGDIIGPFTVLHTPGHTSGSICLWDAKSKILISGDTLFRHSHGRTDLGGNDYEMRKSLSRLLNQNTNTLAAETKIFPGHGEESTIGEERAYFFG